MSVRILKSSSIVSRQHDREISTSLYFRHIELKCQNINNSTMTTPTQDQLDIKEWSFSPDDRQRRKERIQQRLQHRSTTKTNTATKSTSCFCCLKKSIKKTTQTTPSKSPIQNRKIWELEREYHYNRPSSLHYLYDAFDSTGRFNHLFFEPQHSCY